MTSTAHTPPASTAHGPLAHADYGEHADNGTSDDGTHAPRPRTAPAAPAAQRQDEPAAAHTDHSSADNTGARPYHTPQVPSAQQEKAPLSGAGDTDDDSTRERKPDTTPVVPTTRPDHTPPGPADNTSPAPPERHRDQDETDRETTLTRLFKTHYHPLLRLASHLGADDPENIVAEAYYQLYERWQHLRHKQAAPAYLRTTIHNLTRTHHRHRYATQYHTQLTTTPTETVLSAETTALQRHDHHTLHQALQQLPTRQKQALILRHWHGLKQTEIATLLDVTVGTVKTHTHRALATLTHTLAAHQ
ncbi:RNA polymerase sigma factor [Streptomyces sp. NPDC001056]